MVDQSDEKHSLVPESPGIIHTCIVTHIGVPYMGQYAGCMEA